MIEHHESLRQEYVARINRVTDYIRMHPSGDLRLHTLAKAASFSPYHFHRIFHGMTGETLNTFIRRTRAETAAMKLINNPKMTITSIALHCGFSSSAAFAREFKTFFGMSASQFRNGGPQSFSKIREAASKIDQRFARMGKTPPLPCPILRMQSKL